MIAIETTLATGNVSGFEDAVAAGRKAIDSQNDDKFLAAYDIHRARLAKICPLASTAARVDEPVADAPTELPLPAVPRLRPTAQEDFDPPPTTPAGRIQRWQRKLLDLSLHNRLINHKPAATVIALVQPDGAAIEDQLSGGKRLRLVPPDEATSVGGRGGNESADTALSRHFAAEALRRGDLVIDVPAGDLDRRLTRLRRDVKRDLEEGGNNTLYLAIGFLRWKRPDEDRTQLAPLILVPLSLTKRTSLSQYYVEAGDDDIRINQTLLQLLDQDFECSLHHLADRMPVDNSGVDVEDLLRRFADGVRDLPGLEVMSGAAIATYSFNKYLMWRDLVDQTDTMRQNRVVSRLIDGVTGEDVGDDSGGMMIGPKQVDQIDPATLVLPLPADSSQTAAVAAAAAGRDFVLIGPPGTGKSQTITNIIAGCLADGKTVLFVAEKTAKLEVVHRRLGQVGLGECCVELHSRKADRRSFLDQIKKAWTTPRRGPVTQWERANTELAQHRDQLNAHVQSIHRKHPCGWTVFKAIATVAGSDNVPQVSLDAEVQRSATPESYEATRNLVRRCGDVLHALGDHMPLADRLDRTRWQHRWQTSVVKAANDLRVAATDCQTALGAVASALNLRDGLHRDAPAETFEHLTSLTDQMDRVGNADYQILYKPAFAEICRAMPTLRDELRDYKSEVKALTGRYEILRDLPVDELTQRWDAAVASSGPARWWRRWLTRRALQRLAVDGQVDPAADLPRLKRIQTLLAAIDRNPVRQVESHWRAESTPIDELSGFLQTAMDARRQMQRTGTHLGDLAGVSKRLAPIVRSTDGTRHDTAEKLRWLRGQWAELQSAADALAELTGRSPVVAGAASYLTECFATADVLTNPSADYRAAVDWCEVRQQAINLGVRGLIDHVAAGDLPPKLATSAFELAFATDFLREAIDADEHLAGFRGYHHESLIERFGELDAQVRDLAPARARRGARQSLPNYDTIRPREPLHEIKRQANLQRPSRSIRQLINDIPDEFGKIARCVLMSPLSIAQYLPADRPPFDVVIFDEASQITTWDAIGAIARGRQTIVVGDPKQLPPTNFFGRSDSAEDEDEMPPGMRDMPSVLEELDNAGLPTLRLNWHYRSQHEDLIAFSNHHYYDGGLVTFPAADSSTENGTGIHFKHIDGGKYDRGKSRTNRDEANAIVSELTRQMHLQLQRPEADRLSFGVITFNTQQQTLIADLLDKAVREDETLSWFTAEDNPEPTFVKNLENVQGDERDVILFSLTFGKKVDGRMSMNFGALNQAGGERRLNVAITRARRSLWVVASFTAADMPAGRTTARGVLDLRAFLDFAERGPLAIASTPTGSTDEFDSRFERSVAERLRERGWEVQTQIGVSGLRVDLGIVDPDRPGAYLAGIECDGATYHRSASARDRDQTRQAVLESLGWKILRVWSTDYYYDADAVIDQIDHRLQQRLAEIKAARAEAESTKAQSAKILDPLPPEYHLTDLTQFDTDPELFHEPSYDATLRTIMNQIIRDQGPVLENLVFRQVTKAHGWPRTSQPIRARLQALIADIPATGEADQQFLWPCRPSATFPFRPPAAGGPKRPVSEICDAEIASLITPNDDDSNNSVESLAGRLGVERLTQPTRDRLRQILSDSISQPAAVSCSTDRSTAGQVF